MNILIFAKDYPPSKGGIQTYSYMIARYLAKAGDKLWVMAPYTPDANAFDQQQEFTTIRLNYEGPQFIRRLFLFWAILRLTAEHRIEYIFLPQWFRCSNVISWVFSLRKIPYSVYCYGNEIWFKKRRLTHSQKRLIKGYRSAVKIFAISQYIKELLIKQGIVAEDKIVLVNPGVETGAFANPDKNVLSGLRDELGLEGKKVLLTVARLVPKKGHDMVIGALALLKNKFPNLKYLIVGDGKYKTHLERLIAQNKLQEIVSFTGKVDFSKVHNYYQLCDIYTMPSRVDESDSLAETFGISFIEAAACGKPVIAGKSGGISDAVADGETGFLVDPEDITQIAAAIDRLLQDPELASKMGQAAYQRAARDFSWQKVAGKIRAH